MILVWLHGANVVLDGNSLKWQNSDQVLKMMKNKEVRRCIVQKVRTCRYPDQEVRRYMQEPCSEGAVPQFTLSNAEKHAHVGFIIFGPWYLAHRSLSYGFGLWYCFYIIIIIIEPQVFGPLVLVLYGFASWF